MKRICDYVLSVAIAIALLAGTAHASIDVLTGNGRADYTIFQKDNATSTLVLQNHNGAMIKQESEESVSLVDIAPGINSLDIFTAMPSKTDSMVRNRNYLAENGYLKNGKIPIIVMFDLENAGKMGVQSFSAAPSFEKAKQSVLSLFNSGLGIAASESPEVKDLRIIDAIALESDETTLKNIETLDVVKKIELDQRVDILLSDSVPLINATQVWGQLINGTNVTGFNVSIAIIDTGVDYTHPDLGGCFGSACKVVGGYDFINNDADPMDDHGHGTHVAATSASNGSLKGVAPDAKVYAYKVLNSAGSGSYSQVISGVDRSTDPNNDGNYSDHVDILSMSLGGWGDEDSSLSLAVDRAVNRGVVAVVAAGNSGTSTNAIGTPGSARKAVTVAASDKSDAIAYFSSRGPTPKNNLKPDVAAPGVSICAAEWDSAWSSSRCYDTQHVTISGTSMATPHVSGLAALIKQAHRDWNPEKIKSAMITTTKDIGYSIWAQGSGRVQALKAVNASLATDPASITFGEVSGSNISVLFTVSNLRDTALSLAINTTNITDGTTTYAKGTVNETNVSLAAYSNITLNLTIDTSSMSGNLYGFLNISDGSGNYRVPFAFAKISRLAVTVGHTRSIAPSLIAVHNSDMSVKRSAYYYWDYTGRNYTFSVPSGNYTIYAIGDALNQSLEYMLVANATVSATVNIVLNTSDASIFTVQAEQFNGSSLELYKWFYGMGRKSPSMYSVSKGYLGFSGFTGNRTMYISNTSAFDPGLNFSVYYIGYQPRSKLSTDSNTVWADETFTASDTLYYAGWVFNNVTSATAKTLNYSQPDFIQYNYTYNYPGYDPSENANFQSYAAINFWMSPAIWWDISSWIYQAAPVKRTINIRNTTTFGFWHYIHVNYLRNSSLGGDWRSEFAAVVGQTEEDRNVTTIWPRGSRSTESRNLYFGTSYTPSFFENTNTSVKLADFILRGYTNETYIKKASSVSWYSSDGTSGTVNLPRPNLTIYRNGAQYYTSDSPLSWWFRGWNAVLASSGAYVVNITLPTGYPLYNLTIVTANFTLPAADVNPPRLNNFSMPPRFVVNETIPVTFNITDESLRNVSAFYSYDRATWLEFNVTNASSSYNGTITVANASAAELSIKIVSFDSAGNGITYQFNTPSLLAVAPTITLSASSTDVNRGATVYFSGTSNATKKLAQLRLEHVIDDVFYMYDRTGYGNNQDTYVLGKYNFFWAVPSGQSTSPVAVKVRFNGTGIYLPVNQTINITVNIPQTGMPQYSNIVVFPASPDANDNITINSTWAISGGTMDRVLFESNHTGTLANYSTSNVSTVYNYTIRGAGLAAGTVVSYRFIANNTDGVKNMTAARTLSISQISTNISAGQSSSVVNPNQNNTLWCDYAESGIGDITDATVYAEIDGSNNTMTYRNSRYEYNYSNSATVSKTWTCIANKTSFMPKRAQSSFAISETNAPAFANITASPGTIYRDSNITLNATWSDDSGLNQVIFSSNFSGTWRNYSVATAPSSPYMARYNLTNLTNGQVVGWKYFANDTSGNMNSQMPVQSFTVQNRVPGVVIDSNDNDKGWGERWNAKVNVSDSDNDTLNITLYARPAGGSWSARNSTTATNGTVSLNFSLNISYYNETELMVNVSDGFSVNSTAVNLSIDKDDVTVTIVSGHNGSVSRYGADTILLGIRVYDSDAGEYTNNTESRIIWTKDGSIPYDNEQSCITSNGYCNITLDPDTSFTIGLQNFTGGTLPNSTAYREANATPESLFINGTLFTSVNGPFGVKNRTETIYMNTTVTDDVSNSITADTVSLEYKHAHENSWRSCTPVVDESNGLYTCALNATNLSLGRYGIRYSASKANYTSANTTVHNQFVIANIARYSSRANFTANTSREIAARTGDFNATFQFMLRNNLTDGELNVTFNSTNPAEINLSVAEIGRYLTINVSSELAANMSYVILKVNYTDEEVNQSGIAEESLRLYRYNGTNWTAFDPPLGGVNTTENYVWGNLTSFSDFGVGGKKVDNTSCASNNECNSGNCAADYDGSGAWCAPANYCSHDYVTTYTANFSLCDGSVLRTCSFGSWSGQTCSNGCSAGTCVTSSSSSSSGGGSSGGSATVVVVEAAAKSKQIKQTTAYQKANLDSALAGVKNAISRIMAINDSTFSSYKITTKDILDKISVTRKTDAVYNTSVVSVSYAGNRTINDFFIYDTVPKALANHSSLITASTDHLGKIELIESDPVYLFYYQKIYPLERIEITYKINRTFNESLIDIIPVPVFVAGYYDKESTAPTTTTIPPIQQQTEMPQIARIAMDYGVWLVLFLAAAIILGYLYYHGHHHVKKAKSYIIGYRPRKRRRKAG